MYQKHSFARPTRRRKKANTDEIEAHVHDVLCGRGNFANYHDGNARFRELVKNYKLDYVTCIKSQKKGYSQLIYDKIQQLDPPGRFLKYEDELDIWIDIGEKRALEKIRQALREGAPDIRRVLSPEHRAAEMMIDLKRVHQSGSSQTPTDEMNSSCSRNETKLHQSESSQTPDDEIKFTNSSRSSIGKKRHQSRSNQTPAGKAISMSPSHSSIEKKRHQSRRSQAPAGEAQFVNSSHSSIGKKPFQSRRNQTPTDEVKSMNPSHSSIEINRSSITPTEVKSMDSSHSTIETKLNLPRKGRTLQHKATTEQLESCEFKSNHTNSNEIGADFSRFLSPEEEALDLPSSYEISFDSKTTSQPVISRFNTSRFYASAAIPGPKIIPTRYF